MNQVAPFPDIRRLIPLLGSDKDGEVLAAVSAIGRSLKGAGRDWHDLARTVAVGAVAHRQPDPADDPIESPSLRMARFCMNNLGRLTITERDFIQNVFRKAAYGTALTENQNRWLRTIFVVLGGRSG